MKSCRGCRHYFKKWRVCRAADPSEMTPFEIDIGHMLYGAPSYVVGRSTPSLYDGRPEQWVYASLPPISRMRSPEGRCGPSASLWSPNWWRRLLWMTRPPEVPLTPAEDRAIEELLR